MPSERETDGSSARTSIEPDPTTTRRHRWWFGAAAAAAAVVAGVFGLVGDGVDATASGPAGFVLDHLHTVVWLLLAAALAVAAVRGAWGRISGTVAVIAGGCYLVFLATLIGHG